MANINNGRIGISIAELVTACSVMLGSGLLFWKNTDVRLSALELQVNEQKANTNTIMYKLDNVQDGVNDIKIKLENKQDRPK